MEKNICLMCEQEAQSGLRIFSSLLCTDCEQALLRTDPDDPRYAVFVRKLKDVWPACESSLCK
jgi:hypothetical protein